MSQGAAESLPVSRAAPPAVAPAISGHIFLAVR